MNVAPRRAAVALVLGLLARRGHAEQSHDAGWQPGPHTAGRVAGEIDRPFDDDAADGVYDRFDGPFTLGAGIGVEQAAHQNAVRGAARAQLHYYWAAGIYTTYSRPLSNAGGAYRDALGVGVDFRPAFLPRWAKNMEQGPAVLDLSLDSISLGLGAFWQKPEHGDFGQRRGFEASLGFGLPLFGRATGLWLNLRGVLRWPDAASTEPAAFVLLDYDQVLGGAASPVSRGLSPD